MPATLTASQLQSALTNEQLVAARTKGIAPGDSVDPVAEEITTALAKVDAYCTGFTVPPGLLTGWARALAAHNVAKRLGTPTDSQVRDFDRANKELEDIRDGKFRNLTPLSGKVSSGSRPKVI